MQTKEEIEKKLRILRRPSLGRDIGSCCFAESNEDYYFEKKYMYQPSDVIQSIYANNRLTDSDIPILYGMALLGVVQESVLYEFLSWYRRYMAKVGMSKFRFSGMNHADDFHNALDRLTVGGLLIRFNYVGNRKMALYALPELAYTVVNVRLEKNFKCTNKRSMRGFLPASEILAFGATSFAMVRLLDSIPEESVKEISENCIWKSNDTGVYQMDGEILTSHEDKVCSIAFAHYYNSAVPEKECLEQEREKLLKLRLKEIIFWMLGRQKNGLMAQVIVVCQDQTDVQRFADALANSKFSEFSNYIYYTSEGMIRASKTYGEALLWMSSPKTDEKGYRRFRTVKFGPQTPFL